MRAGLKIQGSRINKLITSVEHAQRAFEISYSPCFSSARLPYLTLIGVGSPGTHLRIKGLGALGGLPTVSS